MSAVPVHEGEPWVPAHLQLEVTRHFITLNGTSKVTGLVTATLRPKAVRWSDATALDVEMTLTGPEEDVYRTLRAVIAEVIA